MSEDRTTIIISKLAKGDFLKDASQSLSLADQIKLAILNLAPDSNGDFVHNIIHWSNLPSLSRIIIIFKTPAAAALAHLYLASAYDEGAMFALPRSAKLSLQANLLQRSKSFDSLNEKELAVSSSLENFRNFHNGCVTEYQEPEPRLFDAYADLKKLGIDVSAFNSSEAVDEMRGDKSPVSAGPKPGLDRSRSLTKTLFKPALRVLMPNTSHHGPASPTITLDETL